jgi:hypothetical protein
MQVHSSRKRQQPRRWHPFTGSLVFAAFMLLGAGRPLPIGDLLREHLSVVTTEEGVTLIPRSDINRTVELFNTFGKTIEVADVLAILNSEPALRVFTDHEDDVYNPNYRILRNLLEGNFGFEIHPRAQAVISFLLAHCKDDVVEFDYHLELRAGASPEQMWLAVNLLNHEIGGTLDAAELDQLLAFGSLFQGSTQSVGELYRLKGNLTFESHRVKQDFDGWLQSLTKGLPRLPDGKVQQL